MARQSSQAALQGHWLSKIRSGSQQHPGGKRLSTTIETVYSLGPKNRANAAQFPRKLFLYDRPCREAVSCWANMHAVGLKFICAFELWGK
jgi:hypothetical protein